MIDEVIWEEVARHVDRAAGQTWDGCHKIYVAMDDEQVERMTQNGYEVLPPNLQQIREWYAMSCELKFVNAVSYDDGGSDYEQLIPQFEDEED